MKRLTLLSVLFFATLSFANQGPFYAVQDDVDVIIGPIAVYSADGTTLATYDFNTTGLAITCMSPQSATTHEFTQAAAEIDDEASHTTHGDPAAGQIGLDVDATGLSFLHFTDDLWSVTDWRQYSCHMTDGQTAIMDTDFVIWRVEASDDVAEATRAEMDANSTRLTDIFGDTNELQVDWTDGGRLDSLLDDVLVDTGTTLPARFDGVEGATFDTATDSLEAIRDRGDAAWITGGGGGGGGTVDLTAQAITDIWAHVLEPNGSITAKCAIAVQLAALSGEFLQSGGTVTITDHTGATTRVTATVTANGRNDVTYTCP